MGWHEDHRNAVADRWTKKYHESGMAKEEFINYMRKFMIQGGWDEIDINIMISQVIKKRW